MTLSPSPENSEYALRYLYLTVSGRILGLGMKRAFSIHSSISLREGMRAFITYLMKLVNSVGSIDSGIPLNLMISHLEGSSRAAIGDDEA